MAITNGAARAQFLRAIVAAAEGAKVTAAVAAAETAAASRTVAAVLDDALHRVAVLSGRDGMPRSLASTYACYVTHFIGSDVQREETRYAMLPKDLRGLYGGIDVSRDGLRLFIAYPHRDVVAVVSVWSGNELTRVCGTESRSFLTPQDVCVAEDDFVFIAVANSNRVQVMTPRLDFHGFIGEGHLRIPTAVCANATVVVVATTQYSGYVKVMKVFCRGSGAFLHRFGAEMQMCTPYGMCFCDGGANIAIAGTADACVWVVGATGKLVRRFRTHQRQTYSIACVRSSGELVAAGLQVGHVAVFDDSSDVVKSFVGNPIRVCVHGTTVITLETRGFHSEEPCRIRIWGQDLRRYNDESSAIP